jgi:signal recognition particle receptor subunit beta
MTFQPEAQRTSKVSGENIMPIVNYKSREINCKIVYVGPSLGGKTTSIMALHSSVPSQHKSHLQTVNTEGDRTLFFDYFSLDLAQIKGLRTNFLIYGVPGQPHYRSTRKMVLNGVDGLIFVADSQRHRLTDNLESMDDLKEMLDEYGYDYDAIPIVFQYNKRDLPDLIPGTELDQALNDRQAQSFESVAIHTKGVIEAFRVLCCEVIEKLNAELASRSPA